MRRSQQDGHSIASALADGLQGLVTGLDDPKIADEAKDAGAVALLKKGALHDQLKEAIIAAAASANRTAGV